MAEITIPEAVEVKLAPPGAGLPKPELFVARILFGYRCLTGTPRVFKERFERERKLIRNLVTPLNVDSASRRVLIPRLRGLEDSSRNWSVWMTLDHLRIVNYSIANAIAKLLKGKIPERTASTAAVKPSPEVTADVIEPYEQSCDAVLRAASDSDNLKTKLRYAHPWFGPLRAFEWYALAGTHMQIHRHQIEGILSLSTGSRTRTP